MLHLLNTPVIELHMPNLTTMSHRPSPTQESPPGGSLDLRILLVEDDATNAFFMQEMLESMGLPTPLHARNGREALEWLSTHPVDMVFMDCRMPEMDGYEATRLWREQEEAEELPRLPIIALTANVMAEDRASCLAAGMDDFLSKPVTEQDLRQTLLNLFGERAAALRQEPAPPVHALVGNTERQILNRPALEELCAALGEESVQHLIQTFLSGLPGKLQELHQGVAHAQAEAVHRIAHTLKSNCGILKAERMADLCHTISTLSDRQELEQIPPLEQRLNAEKSALLQAIVAWNSSRNPPSQA